MADNKQIPGIPSGISHKDKNGDIHSVVPLTSNDIKVIQNTVNTAHQNSESLKELNKKLENVITKSEIGKAGIVIAEKNYTQVDQQANMPENCYVWVPFTKDDQYVAIGDNGKPVDPNKQIHYYKVLFKDATSKQVTEIQRVFAQADLSEYKKIKYVNAVPTPDTMVVDTLYIYPQKDLLKAP